MAPVIHQRTFRTLGELVARASEELPATSRLQQRSSRKEGRGKDWDDGLGFDGTVRLSKVGWSDGAHRVREVVELVGEILKAKSWEQGYEHRVTGAFLDIGRYVTGEPEFMIDFTPSERPIKPLKIVVNVVASCGVTGERMIRRGAAIVAAIDVLEKNGYMVECEVCYTLSRGWRGSGYGGGEFHNTSLVVKEMGQHIVFDHLAFAIAHPAFPRRICFGIQEMEDDDLRERFGITPGGGYGSVADIKHENCDLYFKGNLYGRDGEFETAEASARWVRNTLLKHKLVDAEVFSDSNLQS